MLSPALWLVALNSLRYAKHLFRALGMNKFHFAHPRQSVGWWINASSIDKAQIHDYPTGIAAATILNEVSVRRKSHPVMFSPSRVTHEACVTIDIVRIGQWLYDPRLICISTGNPMPSPILLRSHMDYKCVLGSGKNDMPCIVRGTFIRSTISTAAMTRMFIL
ncbi:hypothetical protein BDZ94DRAFT_1252576 [Collybia nuda]|uniref:Uncharacterized protein n=1 Tax=Collybia nuda TaxID=64659 RepID=A0A9P6CMP6_9AGAR|nr:hypothetical protein BDZ94DRAFT_1252576 [Collybia nuda]